MTEKQHWPFPPFPCSPQKELPYSSTELFGPLSGVGAPSGEAFGGRILWGFILHAAPHAVQCFVDHNKRRAYLHLPNSQDGCVLRV